MLSWSPREFLAERVSVVVVLAIVMALTVATISAAFATVIGAAVIVVRVNSRDFAVVVAVTRTSAVTIAAFAFVTFLITELVVHEFFVITGLKNFG